MASAERALTARERTELEAQLSRLPTASARTRRGLRDALVTWTATMFVFAVAWAIVATLVRTFTQVDLGWKSPSALPILFIGAVVCATYATVSVLRWMRRWPYARPLVVRDLAAGVVTEENLGFTAAKRFQEQEHGGLIYFLLTNDHRVFVLYDHESQDLGAQDRNPLDSSFRPHARLQIVRAPASRYVLSSVFSGPPLQLENPLDLDVPPNQWPETEEFCDIGWDDLEGRFGPKRGS